VFEVVPELVKVLDDYPIITMPATEEANIAFFQFLKAKSDMYLSSTLSSLHIMKNKNNGVVGLQTLQRLCCTLDKEERRSAQTLFNALLIDSKESMAVFNYRFNKTILHARACGLILTNDEIADQYLSAIRYIKNPSLTPYIEKYKCIRDAEERVLLTETLLN
jgi:hypothetical protein